MKSNKGNNDCGNRIKGLEKILEKILAQEEKKDED